MWPFAKAKSRYKEIDIMTHPVPVVGVSVSPEVEFVARALYEKDWWVSTITSVDPPPRKIEWEEFVQLDRGEVRTRFIRRAEIAIEAIDVYRQRFVCTYR